MVNAHYIPHPEKTAAVYGGILGARIKEGARPLLPALLISDGIAYVSAQVGEAFSTERINTRRVEYEGAEYFPLDDLDHLVGTLQEETRKRREEEEKRKKQSTAFTVEQSLIDRLKQREGAAYKELYNRAYDSIVERLSGIITDENVRKEAAHDFFAILYENRINRARDDDFPSWLLINAELYGRLYKPKQSRSRPSMNTKSELKGYLSGEQLLVLSLRYDDKETYGNIAKIRGREMIDIAIELGKIRMKIKEKSALFASEFPL